MIFGYARVSTEDQNLDAQIDALKAAGVARIFQEKKTGKTTNRPELEKVIEHLREGDVLVVTKYDRLARSLRDLIDLGGAYGDQPAHDGLWQAAQATGHLITQPSPPCRHKSPI